MNELWCIIFNADDMSKEGYEWIIAVTELACQQIHLHDNDYCMSAHIIGSVWGRVERSPE